MSAFKIVGRYTSNTPLWMHGQIGRQCKKRVYVCKADFDKYGPDIFTRWTEFMGLSVEAFELVNGIWQVVPAPLDHPSRATRE
jgi:hypothetical protein